MKLSYASFITASVMAILSVAPAFSPAAYTFSNSISAVAVDDDSLSDSQLDSDSEYSSDRVVSGDYVYSVLSDGSACIEEFRGDAGDITVPDSIDNLKVTALGDDTFNNTGVTSVTIPASITSVGKYTFSDCYALTNIFVEDGSDSFKSVDGILFSKDGKSIFAYPQCKSGDSYKIPDGVENIETAAFYASTLSSVSFPASLSSIAHHAFSYNERISSIDLTGTKITSIDDMAFAYCTSLSSVLLPTELTSIGSGSFAGCSAITEFKIPDKVTSIGQNAFAGTGLKSITVPQSVETIGYCAFGYDADLKAVEGFVVKGVKGSAAESYCTESDDENNYVNNFTFKEADQNELQYNGLKESQSGYFKYAVVNGEAYITSCGSSVDKPEIPSEIDGHPVTRIYGGAFMQAACTKVVIPDSVKMIDIMAFSGCTMLKELSLPEGLTEIKAEAFSGCSALQSVTIPASCTTIGDNAFADCSKLQKILVADGSSSFSSIGGVLFNASKDTIVRYPMGISAKSYTVPSSVKTIHPFAFSHVASLSSIDLGSVSSIGEDAFTNCTGLKSITIPDSVTELKTKSSGTFSGCSSLKSVKLGKNLKTIGDSSFYDCTSLSEVSFPKNLKVISSYAFYDCPKLLSVRLGNKLTEINTAALGYLYDESSSKDVAVKGFKIYADKNSGGANYAKICKFTCVSDTYPVFGLNVRKGACIGALALLGVLILAAVTSIVVKLLKKRKNTKKAALLKQNAADAINNLKNAAESLNSVSDTASASSDTSDISQNSASDKASAPTDTSSSDKKSDEN